MPKIERCTQCKNPHFDGMCSCGQWGEAEERKAAEWHEKHDAKTAKMMAEVDRRLKAEAAEIDANLAPKEDLEGLWAKKTFREQMDDPNPGHRAPRTLCGWCDKEMEQGQKILNGKHVMVCPDGCEQQWRMGAIEGLYQRPKEVPREPAG